MKALVVSPTRNAPCHRGARPWAAPLAAWALAFALAPSAGLAQAGEGTTRAIEVEATVAAPRAEVWNAWSTAAGAQSFIAPRANIDLRLGGAYEIYFNPADDRMSTRGMKLLSYAPGEMLSFEWNFPRDAFPELTGEKTWVVVQLRPEGANQTQVRITHLGWQQGATWDRAYTHMERGWRELLERLNVRFAKGPIDWVAQKMMWQERADRH